MRLLFYLFWREAPIFAAVWVSAPRMNQINPGKETKFILIPIQSVIILPKNFQKALQMTKEYLLNDLESPRIMNINCWNEWTEGSYLEPDMIHGDAYLEAIKRVMRK